MNTNAYDHILVPTDLSEFDDLAIRYALLFNKHLGSKITMLHAEEVSWLGAEHPVGYYFENPNEAKEELRARLAEFAHRVTPESARVATIFVDDAPEHAIVNKAREIHADLIMMATHGRYGLRRAIVGSVTESVLRHTTLPVLTVTPRLFAVDDKIALRTILCPVNFSDVARASFKQAKAMAKAFDAELIAIHVAEDGLDDVEKRLSAWIEPRYKKIVVKGDPASTVLDAADQIHADLIVIGAQHKLFHDTTVVGTTTERITRFARHAVLTVVRKPVARHAEEREEALTV